MLVILRILLGATATFADRWLAQGQYVDTVVLTRIWATGDHG